ncbi:Aste57867_15604 [Aphanomyces stellatus]|uniref:Aste57867_15604 protein n=1 Tax=Aphanomyces stellatus TaxID=120398 RepID=A0A485L3H8_9STRA|nr:hypothetical protein As57867_015548 [Aphanomyces stellatus]VFT92405.1 Aste57867_15604 [Aphanomyces stellatus]
MSKTLPTMDIPLSTKSEDVLLNDDHGYDFDERVGDARLCKEIGTEAHKAGDKERAIKLYERALYHVAFPDNDWEYEFEEIHKRTVRETRLPIYLNLAAIFLSQDDDQLVHCKDNCEYALRIDARNVKALYRMGQACLRLDDLDKAKEYLKKAADVNPKDKAIRDALAECNRRLKVEDEKAKKMWAKSFKDDDKTPSKAAVAADEPTADVAAAAP